MNKLAILMALTTMLMPLSAKAGFILVTGADTIVNDNNDGASGADVGDGFHTSTPGTFTSYTPDAAADPQLAPGDLANFHYTMSGTVDSVSGSTVHYNGTYEIAYGGSAIRVSSGTFETTATFTGGNTANLAGTMTQTLGPAHPAFADFGALYGGNPVQVTGSYVGNVADGGATATIQMTLTQTAAAVPEPASIALAGLAAVGAVVARRRMSRA